MDRLVADVNHASVKTVRRPIAHAGIALSLANINVMLTVDEQSDFHQCRGFIMSCRKIMRVTINGMVFRAVLTYCRVGADGKLDEDISASNITRKYVVISVVVRTNISAPALSRIFDNSITFNCVIHGVSVKTVT